MAFTYDPSTSAGLVRLMIADTDPANFIFEDSEIAAFLILEAASDGTQYPRLAAAAALNVMAVNQAMILKVMTLLDLQTDGAKVAQALREQAKELRDAEEAIPAFDFAEQVFDQFSARQRIYKQWLRLRQ